MVRKDVSGLLLVAVVCCILFITRISWKQPISQLLQTCRKHAAYIPSHRSSFFVPNLFHAPEFLVPSSSVADVETAFFKFLKWKDYGCNSSIRLGSSRDGGWNMCLDPGLKPIKDNCLVYSFGIARDFTFDDAVAKLLRCEVHSFDPSIRMKDHIRGEKIHFHDAGLYGKSMGPNLLWKLKRNETATKWKMFTLKEFMEKFNHTENILDMLKFDIEYSELDSLPNMIDEGSLLNVKQIAFELHLNTEVSVTEMYWISIIFLHLDMLGYKQWQYHENRRCRITSPNTGNSVSLCHELYFVNTNFVTQLKKRR